MDASALCVCVVCCCCCCCLCNPGVFHTPYQDCSLCTTIVYCNWSRHCTVRNKYTHIGRSSTSSATIAYIQRKNSFRELFSGDKNVKNKCFFSVISCLSLPIFTQYLSIVHRFQVIILRHHTVPFHPVFILIQ